MANLLLAVIEGVENQQFSVLLPAGEIPVKLVPAGTGAGGFLVGPFASRPAATPANAQTVYQPTDGHGPAVSDGAAWRPIINGIYSKEPPLAANWTEVVNIGSGLPLADSKGTIFYDNPTNDSAVNWRGYGLDMSNAPGAPCFVESMFLQAGGQTTGPTAFSVFGIFLQEKSSGKLVSLQTATNNNTNVTTLAFDAWISPTNRNTDTSFSLQIENNGPTKLRLKVAPGPPNLLHVQYTRWSNDTGDDGWHDLVLPVSLPTVFTTGPDIAGIGGLSLGGMVIKGYVQHWDYGPHAPLLEQLLLEAPPEALLLEAPPAPEFLLRHTTISANVLPPADPDAPDDPIHTMQRAAALAPSEPEEIPLHAMNARPPGAPDPDAPDVATHTPDAGSRRPYVPAAVVEAPRVVMGAGRPLPPADGPVDVAGVPSVTNDFDALNAPPLPVEAPVHSLNAYARQQEIANQELARLAALRQADAATRPLPLPVGNVASAWAAQAVAAQAARATKFSQGGDELANPPGEISPQNEGVPKLPADANAPAPGQAPVVVEGATVDDVTNAIGRDLWEKEQADPFPEETHVDDDRAVVVSDADVDALEDTKPPTQRNS